MTVTKVAIWTHGAAMMEAFFLVLIFVVVAVMWAIFIKIMSYGLLYDPAATASGTAAAAVGGEGGEDGDLNNNNNNDGH